MWKKFWLNLFWWKVNEMMKTGLLILCLKHLHFCSALLIIASTEQACKKAEGFRPLICVFETWKNVLDIVYYVWMVRYIRVNKQGRCYFGVFYCFERWKKIQILSKRGTNKCKIGPNCCRSLNMIWSSIVVWCFELFVLYLYARGSRPSTGRSKIDKVVFRRL